MGEAYILGTGYTRIHRYFEKSLEDLAFEAATSAVEEAGNPEIDCLIVSNSFSSLLQSQNLLSPLLAEDLGLKGVSVYTVESGSIGGHAAVTLAHRLAVSGAYENILVIGVEKLSDYRSNIMYRALSQLTNSDFEAFYGATPLSLYAIMAGEYLHRYSIDEEYLAEWPVLMHDNAASTSHAQLRFKLTREKVLSSDYASKPIKQLMLPPMSDGAAALVVSGARGVDAGPSRAKAIIKAAEIVNGTFELSVREDMLYIDSLDTLRKRLVNTAKDWGHSIDVIDVTDHYSIGGPLIMENLGLIGKGQTLKELARGRFRPGDKPIINPTGGVKARGNPVGALGVYQVAELTDLLSGRNVAGRPIEAEKALAVGLAGIGAAAAGILLEKT